MTKTCFGCRYLKHILNAAGTKIISYKCCCPDTTAAGQQPEKGCRNYTSYYRDMVFFRLSGIEVKYD